MQSNGAHHAPLPLTGERNMKADFRLHPSCEEVEGATPGTSRHVAAPRNLVAIGAWRTLTTRSPGKSMGPWPDHQPLQRCGTVVRAPLLGGLHHRYRRT